MGLRTTKVDEKEGGVILSVSEGPAFFVHP